MTHLRSVSLLSTVFEVFVEFTSVGQTLMGPPLIKRDFDIKLKTSQGFQEALS
jgi:hypothetical protein